MPMNRIALRVGVAVAIIAAVAVVVAVRSRSPEQQPAAAGPPLRITGIYADDWQDNCGALANPAQAECTRRLDAKYGRAEDVPVPRAENNPVPRAEK